MNNEVKVKVTRAYLNIHAGRLPSVILLRLLCLSLVVNFVTEKIKRWHYQQHSTFSVASSLADLASCTHQQQA